MMQIRRFWSKQEAEQIFQDLQEENGEGGWYLLLTSYYGISITVVLISETQTVDSNLFLPNHIMPPQASSTATIPR
jgi:hypothetical protein